VHLHTGARDLRKEAEALLAAVPRQHVNARFDAFVKERELDMPTRDALWRVLLLRSNQCSKLSASGNMDNAPCFCNSCVDWRQMEMASADEKHGVTILTVYPKYEWVPPPITDAISKEQEELERKIHAYLQRVNKLPQPLPDMLDEHLKLLPSTNRHLFGQEGSSKLLLKDLAQQAMRCHVLWLMFCGHGTAPSSGFVMADCSRIALSDVAGALSTAGFTGTLLVSVNACFAEFFRLPPPPGEDSAPFDGLHACLPFRWVVFYSCSNELQKPSHANHVARLLGKLASEKPAYSQLSDRVSDLWVATRSPEERPFQWRSPPLVQMGGRYSGRFLEPATPQVPESKKIASESSESGV